DIANIGAWTTFYPRDLEKLQLKLIEKPNPNISTSSIPKNPWTISLPNNTDIRVKRLKKENIKEQLETHGILKDINMNRKELVKELELALAKETLEKTLASENLEYSSISSLSNHVQNLPENEKSDAESNVRIVAPK
ncbi:14457_t:CDS:2, partial [Gigaspora rosea]